MKTGTRLTVCLPPLVAHCRPDSASSASQRRRRMAKTVKHRPRQSRNSRKRYLITLELEHSKGVVVGSAVLRPHVAAVGLVRSSVCRSLRPAGGARARGRVGMGGLQGAAGVHQGRQSCFVQETGDTKPELSPKGGEGRQEAQVGELVQVRRDGGWVLLTYCPCCLLPHDSMGPRRGACC